MDRAICHEGTSNGMRIIMITGDVSQVDLPRHIKSGLLQSINILDGVKGIGMIKLDKRDVIRHKLVESIIDRYESLPQNDK